MPLPTTQTYTDGLEKVVASYVSDDGTTYRISMRKGYITAGISTCAQAAGGTQPNLPRRRHPRCLHLISTTPGPGGQQLKRKVPMDAGALNGFQPGQTYPNVTVDGMTWRVAGFHGESTK